MYFIVTLVIYKLSYQIKCYVFSMIQAALLGDFLFQKSSSILQRKSWNFVEEIIIAKSIISWMNTYVECARASCVDFYNSVPYFVNISKHLLVTLLLKHLQIGVCVDNMHL